jgi:hypothetical protein
MQEISMSLDLTKLIIIHVHILNDWCDDNSDAHPNENNIIIYN